MSSFRVFFVGLAFFYFLNALLGWVVISFLDETQMLSGGPSPTVVFTHPPKCGGTSMRAILERGLAGQEGELVAKLVVDEACSARHPHEAHVPYQCLPSTLQGVGVLRLTVLRYPPDRLVSKYEYVRQVNKRAKEYALFSQKSLEDLVSENFFTNKGSNIYERFFSNPDKRESAIQVLTEKYVVGLLSEMTDTLLLFTYHLKRVGFKRVVLSPMHRNKTERGNISAAVKAGLREQLAEDMAIYQAAEKHFHRLCKEARGEGIHDTDFTPPLF